jgi:hypothetical protein
VVKYLRTKIEDLAQPQASGDQPPLWTTHGLDPFYPVIRDSVLLFLEHHLWQEQWDPAKARETVEEKMQVTWQDCGPFEVCIHKGHRGAAWYLYDRKHIEHLEKFEFWWMFTFQHPKYIPAPVGIGRKAALEVWNLEFSMLFELVQGCCVPPIETPVDDEVPIIV